MHKRKSSAYVLSHDFLSGNTIRFFFKNYTTVHKFGVGKIVFDRNHLCSPRLHLFDQEYSKQ